MNKYQYLEDQIEQAAIEFFRTYDAPVDETQIKKMKMIFSEVSQHFNEEFLKAYFSSERLSEFVRLLNGMGFNIARPTSEERKSFTNILSDVSADLSKLKEHSLFHWVSSDCEEQIDHLIMNFNKVNETIKKSWSKSGPVKRTLFEMDAVCCMNDFFKDMIRDSRKSPGVREKGALLSKDLVSVASAMGDRKSADVIEKILAEYASSK